MSISRKEALGELKSMFPDYDRKALNTLLRANGKLFTLYFNNYYTKTVLFKDKYFISSFYLKYR